MYVQPLCLQASIPPGLQLPPGVLLVQQPGGLPTGFVYIRPKTNEAGGNLLSSPPPPPVSAGSTSKVITPINTSGAITQNAAINLLSPPVPGIRSPFLIPKPLGGFPTTPTPLLSPMAPPNVNVNDLISGKPIPPPNVNVNDLLAAKIARQMGGLAKQAPAPPKKPIQPAPKKKPVLEFTPPSNRKYRFSCLECNYTTNRRYNIERHMRTHGSEGLITSEQVRYEELPTVHDDARTKENTAEESDKSEARVCLSPTILDCVKKELDVTQEHDPSPDPEVARNELGLDEVIIEETEGTVIQVEQNLLDSEGSGKLDT